MMRILSILFTLFFFFLSGCASPNNKDAGQLQVSDESPGLRGNPIETINSLKLENQNLKEEIRGMLHGKFHIGMSIEDMKRLDNEYDEIRPSGGVNMDGSLQGVEQRIDYVVLYDNNIRAQIFNFIKNNHVYKLKIEIYQYPPL